MESNSNAPFPANKNNSNIKRESMNFGSETKEDKEYTLRSEAIDLENYLSNSNDIFANSNGGYFSLKPKAPDIFADIIKDKER